MRARVPQPCAGRPDILALLALVIFTVTPGGLLAAAPVVALYEKVPDPASAPASRLDSIVEARLRDRGITPANLCSDEVFVRRAYLDAIGTLPTLEEVTRFLEDPGSRKRESLVEDLLGREEFADYASLRWCDLLRVKSEFPANLWPNAVQAYHRWVHDAIRRNMPYDQFARGLLTSSGSNFRVPQVNFYRAVQGRTPSGIAQAVALTFMGSRRTGWPEGRREGMDSLFSRVAYKPTDEWKEEIVLLDPGATSPLDAILPDGTRVHIPPGKDPRQAFADWLVKAGNPWFARNIVNRIWAWLLGRGIIHEPDDIRPDNPPSIPELLVYLEGELERSHCDLRHIYGLILSSRTYQRSSITQGPDPEAGALFAHYPIRQLDAEVLIDAICGITGVGEDYWSAIPEPFTFIPGHRRTIQLADGSIGSPFLEMFGRPARDTGLWSERSHQPTEAQRLHLLNSTHIQRKIGQSEKLRKLLRGTRTNIEEGVRLLYLTILSRPPTPEEVACARQHVRGGGVSLPQAAQDLVWALFNSKEFLYRH